MHRLFVALHPPASIHAILLDTMEGIAGARWQDDEQLHLTLRFIGAVERPVAEDVAAALAGLHAEAPTVRLSGVGSFAHRGRTEALWAGLSPQEPLAHLHRKVDQACVRAGLPPERRAYVPHVTLARLPRSMGADPAIATWLATHARLASEPFALSHLILYESHLGQAGASYAAIARWPLGTPCERPGS